jgi:multidrug efflux pump subunit AcrA (membrane-fusion protein)
MSRRTILSLLSVILAAALIGFSLWLLINRPETISQLSVDLGVNRETPAGPVVASGFIEAQEVSVASEYAGRVLTLTVDEGDAVAAGQLLLALDTTLLDAQIGAAAVAVEVAEAQEGQVAAGARTEALRVAEAEVARAHAASDAAYQAWQDAILLRDNPQELQVEITAAQAKLQVTEHQLERSEALRDAAAVGYERFGEVMNQVGPAQRVEVASGPLPTLAPLLEQILPPDVYRAVMSGGDGTYSGGDYEVVVAGGQATVYKKVGLQLDFHLLPNTYWQAGAAVNVAQAARDGARATLNHLRSVAADPQAAQAQVDAAHSAYLTAQANLEAARASLETLKAGATEQELALARTQVEQARADLSILETQRAYTRLTAPQSGVVTQRHIDPGELVVPGAPLLTLADLSIVTLTVYVPVDELGRVHLGQAVSVGVDSFPERTFQGLVVTIADEAEFTPSATQTEEERVNLVFAVKVRLANVDDSLKPGMPADATFMGESAK